MAEFVERRLFGAGDVVWVLLVSAIVAALSLLAVGHLETRFELVKLSAELDALADERQRLEEQRDGLYTELQELASPDAVRAYAEQSGLRAPHADEVIRLAGAR